jgi:ParB family chromosome partitioning protein
MGQKNTKNTRKQAAPKAGRRRRKPSGSSVGLLATELNALPPPEDVSELRRSVEEGGGKVLAAYREPYGARWILLTALPINQIAPTPYQRNISDTHVRKLEGAIGKIGRFLDPIIVVQARQGPDNEAQYWTPNGHHRLSAMRSLGAKSIMALLVPEIAAAYQILALNTEKAHNLREKALEVVRMYRELAGLGDAQEESYGLEFEEPALITLGLRYEARPRFSGGAYHPVLKRVDQFLPGPLNHALAAREARAKALLDLDDAVVRQVEQLKGQGLTSPYLKSFVVARINPMRFRPKEAAPLSFEEALERMEKGIAKFDPAKVKVEDLARSGGVPGDGE